jgi:citrate lyase beta subunit
MNINFSYFKSLKGELEAEGLSKIEIAGELVYSLRNNLDYLVKISGSEAISDITYLSRIGVKRLVCPMIESAFSMEKYMRSTEHRGFDQLGVTIETSVAVENIESILDAGVNLNEVTIGRTDLSASIGISDVECEQITSMAKKVAIAAKSRGLTVGLGGSVSALTHKTLNNNKELLSLVDFVETRKAVIPTDYFINNNALNHAIELEFELLRVREISLNRTLKQVSGRIKAIKARI